MLLDNPGGERSCWKEHQLTLGARHLRLIMLLLLPLRRLELFHEKMFEKVSNRKDSGQRPLVGTGVHGRSGGGEAGVPRGDHLGL